MHIAATTCDIMLTKLGLRMPYAYMLAFMHAFNTPHSPGVEVVRIHLKHYCARIASDMCAEKHRFLGIRVRKHFTRGNTHLYDIGKLDSLLLTVLLYSYSGCYFCVIFQDNTGLSQLY